MTNEELVEQVQAGIDTAHNMEQLYLQNRNFIYQVAKKYSSRVYLKTEKCPKAKKKT